MNELLEAKNEPSSPIGVNREIYQELRRIAAGRMAGQFAQTLQPTALVHEAWLRMEGASGWHDHGHFLASASTTMRRILVDHARRKASVRHGGGLHRVDTETERNLAAPLPDDRILLLDEGITELEKSHPLHAAVVVARFFAGLTTRETAEELSLSERSVERHWAFAKAWLFRWIRQKS